MLVGKSVAEIEKIVDGLDSDTMVEQLEHVRELMQTASEGAEYRHLSFIENTLLYFLGSGYTYQGMTKISFKQALELFRNDEEVFVLYDDNSEALVKREDDLYKHNEHGGEFGVEG